MAKRAVVIEVVGHVIRVLHLLIGRLVTGITISRRTGVTGAVTRDATCRSMRPGQWETGRGVIKSRR